MEQEQSQLEYVGFWARVGASLIDSVLLLAVLYPLFALVHWRDGSPLSIGAGGSGGLGGFGGLSGLGGLGGLRGSGGADSLLFEWLLPAAAVIAFWLARQATPGKMLIGARIVDAHTGREPGAGQALARYLGYFISTIPLGLGLIWVGLDARKQGWHDKIAGTVVVRSRATSARRSHLRSGAK